MEGIRNECSASEIIEGEIKARKREKPSNLKFFALLNLGLFLTAVGIEVFKSPNNFAFGGTSGLAVVLTALFPGMPVSAFMWAINIGLVVLGIVFLDWRTMGWTVFASFALSAYVSLLEWLIPLSGPLTSDPLLELIYATVLPAVGAAVVFNIGASTGGTDILAMILQRHSSLEIGKALMVVDIAIVAVAAVLFGPHTGLYCLLGLVAKAFVVDGFIESINLRKVITIVSNNPDPVLGFLVHDLKRTANIRHEVGGFSGQEQRVLVTVLTRREATQLRLFLAETDPTAFMTVVNSSEIIGRGFRGL